MTVRVVYSDLDGTMVGPRGCFFRTEDAALTLAPAEALLALHAAGVALVLVSGRTRAQLTDAARVFGADGFVGEMGAVLGWDGGRSGRVLPGAFPPALLAGGCTPYDAVWDSGAWTACSPGTPGGSSPTRRGTPGTRRTSCSAVASIRRPSRRSSRPRGWAGCVRRRPGRSAAERHGHGGGGRTGLGGSSPLGPRPLSPGDVPVGRAPQPCGGAPP